MVGEFHQKQKDIQSFYCWATGQSAACFLSAEEPAHKVISLSIIVKDKFLVIHTDNFCTQIPVFENGLPVTTKGGNLIGFRPFSA